MLEIPGYVLGFLQRDSLAEICRFLRAVSMRPDGSGVAVTTNERC